MPSTPPDIGQPAREARTGGEDGGQRGNKWWTLVAVCLGTFMLLLDITIVNVALPDIQRALHSSFADLQWVVDAYALTLASFLLTAGSLADIYGRRVLYLIGLVVFTGAPALGALREAGGHGPSHSIHWPDGWARASRRLRSPASSKVRAPSTAKTPPCW